MLTVAVLALRASAGIDFPRDYYKTFGYVDNDLEGWTFYGIPGVPWGDYADYFTNYSESNPVIVAMGIENVVSVWTNSEYRNGQESDTWLVTPEFEVTGDNDILAFTVSAVGMDNTVSNNFEVYISEGGKEKSDFKLFKKSSLTGSIYGYDYMVMANKRYALTGYKGKKIRLAFVNKGNVMGILGFANISVGSWFASGYPAEETTNQILLPSQDKTTKFVYTLDVSTPVTTTRYNVDFKTSGGFSRSYTGRSNIRLAELTTLRIEIEDIPLADAAESFTLTVTPDFEGAVPFTLNGLFIKADQIYDQVCVLEEATGTWCQWCPYGAAALDFYTHKYPASGKGNKVIGIAVHSEDPMMISSKISDYYANFMVRQGIETFPNVCFNRMGLITPSPLPNVFEPLIDAQFSEKSFILGKLDAVYLNPEDDSDMAAVFSVTCTYNTDFRPMNASVVVVEDNVQGSGAGYSQSSCVSSEDTDVDIIKNLGEEWLPYFQLYLDNGASVPAAQMQYNHVARAAYPNYLGKGIPMKGANETYTGKITFPMPSNVSIQENTKVVLLITDSTTGEILTADELEYDDFTFASGVKTIDEEAAAFDCSIASGSLKVTTSTKAHISLYSTDGRLLKTFEAEPGVNYVDIDAPHSVLLLKASGEKLNKTLRLINK